MDGFSIRMMNQCMVFLVPPLPFIWTKRFGYIDIKHNKSCNLQPGSTFF